MEELITYFPEEICLEIIRYTYMPQDKYLLNDIVNYTESKTKLLDLYFNYWILYNQADEYKNWLNNDIVSYVNNFEAIMYGYVDKFYIYLGLLVIQEREDFIQWFIINYYYIYF